MKILVTGGLGSIGSVLTHFLENRGHQVYILDKPHNNKINYLRCDIASFYQLNEIFKKTKFDLVYHLGAEFGRWNGEDFFDTMWNSNVIGTKNIIKLQEEHGFKMVFSSSSEVYGDYQGVMKEEIVTEKFIRPMNDYATSKLVNEIQILNSQDMFNTQTVRVRIFNTYGPGEHFSNYRSVICRFIYSALHNIEYTVYKNHKRTSTYITDLVDGLVAISENFKKGEVYNLAGTDYHNIELLSDIITNQLKIKDPKVKFVDGEKFTTVNKLTDTKKALRDLNLKPKIKLEDGIKKTIEWMKAYYIDKRINREDLYKFL